MPKKLKKEMGFTGFDASLLVSSYNLVFADLLKWQATWIKPVDNLQ